MRRVGGWASILLSGYGYSCQCTDEAAYGSSQFQSSGKPTNASQWLLQDVGTVEAFSREPYVYIKQDPLAAEVPVGDSKTCHPLASTASSPGVTLLHSCWLIGAALQG